MTQKILKVGSSTAVTTPKKSFKELIAWINTFIKRYRPALKALARK